jgi:hypothetical protein
MLVNIVGRNTYYKASMSRAEGLGMAEFSPRVNEDNPDPRIACALLLGTSYSMSAEPIEQLNRGFELFCDEIKKDELAQKRAEIAVITSAGWPGWRSRSTGPNTRHADVCG